MLASVPSPAAAAIDALGASYDGEIASLQAQLRPVAPPAAVPGAGLAETLAGLLASPTESGGPDGDEAMLDAAMPRFAYDGSGSPVAGAASALDLIG